MGNEFRSDVPVFSFIYKLVLLILLGVLWLICCIPLFTIGSATTALYYTTVKAIRRERGNVFSTYFSSFFGNLLPTLFPTILFFLLIGGISYGTVFVFQITRELNSFPLLPYIAAAPIVPVLLIFPYFFPVYSRFDMKFPLLIRNCLYYSIRHIPTTVLFLILIIGGVFLSWQYTYLTMFIPGIFCWLISIPMEKILKKYTPIPENRGEETELPWYLE